MRTRFILAGAAALAFAGASFAQTETPPAQDSTTATPGQGQTTADQARAGGRDFGQSVSEQRHERNKARKAEKNRGTTDYGTPTPEPTPTATPTETPTPAPEANPTPTATPTPQA